MSDEPRSPKRDDLTPERRRLLELMMEERRRRRSLRAQVAPRSEGEPLELSFAQQRLWFIQQLQPRVAAYNIPSAVRLEGPLDATVLDRAIQEIVRRHETLRTRFGFEDGRPVPVVAAEHRVPLDVRDLTDGRTPEEAEAEAQRLVDTLARRPYDLAADDLLRVHLLKVGRENHVLLVVLHHIVSDTWTTGVFLREVAALYAAFVQGQPSPLPELPLQYTDYASWQRRLIREEGLDGEIEYWKERLSDTPPLLELPIDRPRPPLQSFRGGREMLLLPKSLADRLKALGGSEDASLFMVFLAAYQTLLHRYTGQTDVPVGSPIANRDRVELEGMIGLFVNTLVLRSDLSGDLTFRELLRQVREMALGAFAHKELPFEKLVEELDLDRDTGRNPLFQVLFAFQNVPLPALEAQGLSLTRYEFNETTSRLDLELDLQEMPYGFVGWLGYNADLFEAGTVQRMAAHLLRLLEAVAQDADRPLSALPLLGAAERHQLTLGWNDTARPYTRHRSIHQLFEERAASAPQALAVVGGGLELTYGALEAEANRLARLLVRLGAGPGRRVAIYLDRSPRMVVALLGVLKAGATYVPLDPAYPAGRMLDIAAEAGFSLAVTESSRLVALEPLAAGLEHVVSLDEPDAGLAGCRLWGPRELAAEEPVAPPVPHDPDLLAYVIFTSGSTGKPKGVMVRHRPVVNLIEWVNGTFGIGAGDRLLFVTSLCFDLSVYDVFGILAAGATVRVATADELREPARLVEILRDEPITFWDSAPAALQQLTPWFSADGAPESRLRLVFLSGDWIPVSLPDAVRTAFPRAQVVSLGGATETTVWSNVFPVEEVAPWWPSIPYGRPIQNALYLVLDDRAEPLPVGVPGDLYVGGECLADGYLARPALTAERYVPDPFSGRPGQRLYRTGDRARFWSDGNLEFLGRLDQQVKVRGFRIELGEIETVLGQHPHVAAAVAAAWGETGDRRLVAYVVPREGTAPDAAELRAWAARQLPDYMVPWVFHFLDELPLTSNGKIDRRGLPAPERDTVAGAAEYEDPQGEMEATLAALWQRVLGVERVGSRDDFFVLGGHSLLLTQVHRELQATVKPDLALVDLFQHRTVRDLARFLAGGAGGPGLAEVSGQRAAARRSAGTEEGHELAVVGMALRVPGANNAAEFWRNLRAGVESISFFSVEEVLAAGVPPERVAHPDYVRAEGEVDDVDGFDAAFFGFSPREAEIMDPQHRFFLECAWEALEDAGYDPRSTPGSVGVFGGVNISSYLFNNLSDFDALGAMGDFHTRADLLIGNTPDFLTQRVSHQLGLGGPSVAIQSSCSTALVAVHVACQHLLRHECDVALAGGVQMRVPQKLGYLYREGGLPSPDGHCRSFDHRAKGTVHGNGVGLVVIKRLADALADGDHVYGVIKGSSVNNDAGSGVGFTAPSLEGQARVASEALAMAGIDPATLGLLEANGTGTEMGDPIEFTAMKRALSAGTAERNFCALGSVKTNIGHLDTASGVAGLVKALLAVGHGEIPATLHFEKPNPNIELDASPFYVNTDTVPWPDIPGPRRAAVNNFGVGGTNAHVVIEQAPEIARTPSLRPVHLLPLSVRGAAGLHRATERLRARLTGERLVGEPDLEIADVAFTLQVGRRHFPARRLVAASTVAEAVEALASLDPERVATAFHDGEPKTVGLAFPAGEAADVAELAALAAETQEIEPAFRDALAEAAAAAEEAGVPGLLDLLARAAGGGGDVLAGGAADAARLAVLVALGRLFAGWGVRPAACTGEGLGALAAAAVAGTLPLPEAMRRAASGDTGDLPPAEPGAEPALVAPAAAGEAAGAWLVLGPGRLAELSAPAVVSPKASLAGLIRALGDLWLAGAEVEWAAFQSFEPRRRVPLPTYPFEHERFWRRPKVKAAAEAPSLDTKLPLDRWFHAPTWRRSERPATGAEAVPAGRWLLLDRGEPLADALAGFLAGRGAEVVRVRPGDGFAGEGDAFTVRPGRAEDFRAVAERLAAEGRRPERVVHLWLAGGEPAGDDHETAQDLGLRSLVALARAFSGDPLGLLLVTTGAQEVTGEEPLSPARATALAATRVLPQEMPEVLCRAVDLTSAALAAAAARPERLLTELPPSGAAGGPAVAWRGAHRWVQATEALELPAPEEGRPLGTADGAWLVTGAGGDFSRILAGVLAARPGARLALAGTGGLPDDAARELGERAAEVLWIEADTADAEGLRHAVGEAAARLGGLDGVLVAPEDYGEQFAATLAELDRAAEERRLGRRAAALSALAEAVEEAAEVHGRAPAFCLLTSTLAGVLGGLGVVADSAADGLTDLFARRLDRAAQEAAPDGRATRWISLSWDSWAGAGSGQAGAAGQRLAASNLARTAIQPAEAAEVLARVLAAAPGPQVLVSTVDLPARVERWVHRAGMPAPGAGDEEAGRGRPALASPYVPPRNELEESIAGVWRELFGFEEIGVFDDFYELGGHSLLGTQVAARLRDQLRIELPLRELLEHTTVAELAKALAARQVEDTEPEDLEQFLAQLEAMTDEEAAARAE